MLDMERQQLLVFGGNSMEPDADAEMEGADGQDISYLNDLWSLDFGSSSWRRLESSTQVCGWLSGF